MYTTALTGADKKQHLHLMGISSLFWKYIMSWDCLASVSSIHSQMLDFGFVHLKPALIIPLEKFQAAGSTAKSLSLNLPTGAAKSTNFSEMFSVHIISRILFLSVFLCSNRMRRPPRVSRVCWSRSCRALLLTSRPWGFTSFCRSARPCMTPKTTSASPSHWPWPSSGWTPTPAKF